MPIYEYTCQRCAAKFETLVKSMGETGKQPCPECGSKQTARAMSVFAVSGTGGVSTPPEAPSCGRCGGAPGSCMNG